MIRWMVAFGLLASPCWAQSRTPLEQAMGYEIGLLLDAKLACNAKGVETQQALAAAQAKIKELEAKLEKPNAKPEP